MRIAAAHGYARILAALAFAGASAFCAAALAAASNRDIVPRVPNPSLVDPASPPRAEPPRAVLPTPLPPRVADIALVLPLESSAYARAAEAVRDGFLAAAEAAGATGRTRVIGHGDDNVIGAFEAAKSLGVRVVVGPLVRDDLRTLAAGERSLPLTLALNQLDEAAALPREIYTLALAVESDARVIAHRMRADNVQSVAVIGGEAPLSRRLAAAFVGEWLLAGGAAPQVVAFSPTGDGLATLGRELARSNAQAVLIALDGSAAALARNFAPRLPAYASSLVNQELETAALRDLEGVTFVDVPWIVTPHDPALAKLPRRPMASLVLERLYALGLDAFQVAQAFVAGVPERLDLAGATGRITLSEGRHFVRAGALAVFRDGQVVPADGPR